MESWTLKEVSLKKLEAFETWTYRHMLKISWLDRVQNKDDDDFEHVIQIHVHHDRFAT